MNYKNSLKNNKEANESSSPKKNTSVSEIRKNIPAVSLPLRGLPIFISNRDRDALLRNEIM